MSSYWSQWIGTELMSMHGIEPEDFHEDSEYEEVDEAGGESEEEECCPRCSGSGCNYCLMCEY